MKLVWSPAIWPFLFFFSFSFILVQLLFLKAYIDFRNNNNNIFLLSKLPYNKKVSNKIKQE